MRIMGIIWYNMVCMGMHGYNRGCIGVIGCTWVYVV